MVGLQRISPMSPWMSGTMQGLYGQRRLGQDEECPGGVCPTFPGDMLPTSSPQETTQETAQPPVTTPDYNVPPSMTQEQAQRIVALTAEILEKNPKCLDTIQEWSTGISGAEVIARLEACLPESEFPILPVAIGGGALLLLLALS